MDFTFTEEQRMLASAFGKLADEICSPQRLRAVAEGGGAEAGRDGAVRNRAGGRDARDSGSAARWQRLIELGLPGMLAPQGHGGMGLTDIDFVLIAEEAGRSSLPEPLVEHAGVAVPALTEIGSRVTGMLEAAASGETRVAVGHPVNPFVLDAARANYLLLTLGDEVHLVESSRTPLVHQPSIDPLRELFKVEPLLNESTRIATGQLARKISQRALARGSLYCAAQLVGLGARMINLAATYARERKQFGKPIGSYQAIQQQLATARVKLEFARPVLYAAAARADSLDQRAQSRISHAKLAATDAADLAARTALQVHGAMGYSWEVDLHFYMKRAWALAGVWGDRGFHLQRLTALVLEGILALGPGHTFDMRSS
jgi:alkylation response protein AidB-like acyl-CoA dehydrogenase